MTKTPFLSIFLLAWPLTAASFLATAGCDTTQGPAVASDAQPVQPVSIQTAVVQARPIERRAEVVGTLLPNEQVDLRSEVSGIIEKIHADFGGSVRQGQLLVTLEPTEYQLSVQRARAGINEALAWLGLPPEGDEDSVVIDKHPLVVEAEFRLADSRSKLESATTLVKTGDIPAQRHLELEKEFRQREAALRQARDQVQTRIAAVKSRRVDLALAEKNLEDTRVYAPFSGSVVEKHVSPGKYVRDDTALLTLVQTNPLRLRARIPETGVAAARVGLRLSFRTDAHPGRTFDAVITSISPVLDASSRTLVGEAKVINTLGLLKPGMFVTVSIVVTEDSMAVMVPKKALLRFGGLTKLFRVLDTSVEEFLVETGAETEDLIEILDDKVSPGDVVAIGALDQLTHGTPVVH